MDELKKLKNLELEARGDARYESALEGMNEIRKLKDNIDILRKKLGIVKNLGEALLFYKNCKAIEKEQLIISEIEKIKESLKY